MFGNVRLIRIRVAKPCCLFAGVYGVILCSGIVPRLSRSFPAGVSAMWCPGVVQTLFKLCYYGFIASRVLSHLYADFSAERQVNVDARAEFDESQMFVYVAVFFSLGIGYDAAGHRSGYLTAQYLGAFRCFEHYVGVFVLLACLRQPCLVVVAVLVVYELNLAVYREPVGVYVEQAHENAYHQALVMEVFVLLDFFYDYQMYHPEGWQGDRR